LVHVRRQAHWVLIKSLVVGAVLTLLTLALPR
jgi:hypothetical protein